MHHSMQVDVTVEEYTPGWYQYTRHMCESPRFGIDIEEVERGQINFSYAVTWFNDDYIWETKLLPSEALCVRFANMLKKKGDEPLLSRIAPYSS